MATASERAPRRHERDHLGRPHWARATIVVVLIVVFVLLPIVLVLGPPAAATWTLHAHAAWRADGAKVRAARVLHDGTTARCANDNGQD